MAIYISELKGSPGATYDDKKFVEIITTDSEDVSGYSIAVYNASGSLSQTLGLGSHVTTWGGDRAGYVVGQESDFSIDFTDGWSVALIDDTGGVVQILGVGPAPTPVNGPAAGTSPTLLGAVKANKSYTTSDGGTTYAETTYTKGTIPCYAPGTLIETPEGPRAVEMLCPGDLVLTRDNGPQEILWIRSGDHALEEAAEDARPVLIRAGALGRGQPGRDLIVSSQHRILAGGLGQLERFFPSEVFVSAKALTGLPGIRFMRGKKAITWVHFACSGHEMVRANGCWSESLLLGPMMLAGLPADTRRELLSLFPAGPGARDGMALNGPAARPCLTVGEARRMIARARTRENVAAGPDSLVAATAQANAASGQYSMLILRGLSSVPG